MYKILLIEDEDEIRCNVEEILESYNYKVFTAINGKEGLKLAQEILPDLILCDIMMPYLNGYEVLEQLSLEESTINIPFIFLTAKVELTDIRTGMNLGADDYITKPFRAHELLKAVQKRLERVNKLKSVSGFVKKDGPPAKNKERILVNINNKPAFIKISEIKFLSASGEYSDIFLVNGKKFLVRKLLKEWENSLPETTFLRIHRSTIINLDYVEKIEKWYKRSMVIYLKGEKEPFRVSQRYSIKIKENLSI